MAVLTITKEMMTGAEVYHGDEICREKLALLLSELGLPSCLVTAREMEEYGFVRGIGLVWLKLRNRTEQRFVDNIVVSFDTVVSAYVEPRKIRRLTGVRAKGFMVWVKLSEIHVRNSSDDGFITFKTPVGLSRSFPMSLFQQDDNDEGVATTIGEEGGGGGSGCNMIRIDADCIGKHD